ncbi:hypothetical protein JCM6882_001075 [Rhodosporidiobolus microsporus]
MGALTALLKRKDSPPKHPLHSTLDIPLPPPQPLWALATEPSYGGDARESWSTGGSTTGAGQAEGRRGFGPRAPRNVYDDGRARTRTTSVGELAGAVQRVDLSRVGVPRTPVKDGGAGGGGARSAPPTSTAGRRNSPERRERRERRDVYPPFPPAYSLSPPPPRAPPSHSNSNPQPPPYHPSSSLAGPSSSSSTRPPLPPRPGTYPSSCAVHLPTPSYAPPHPTPPPVMPMPEPRHYSFAPSPSAFSSPFSAPALPPPVPPLPPTYPPPPSPPRSPPRLRPSTYSPTRVSFSASHSHASPSQHVASSARGPLPLPPPPLPPRETRPHPVSSPTRPAHASAPAATAAAATAATAAAAAGKVVSPRVGGRRETPQKEDKKNKAAEGKEKGTDPIKKRRTPFRPSPSSSAAYSPSLYSSHSSSSPSSSLSNSDCISDSDESLPSPSRLFLSSRARGAGGKARCVSAPVLPSSSSSPSKPASSSPSPSKAQTPTSRTRTPRRTPRGQAGQVQVQCAGTTHGNHRCTRLVSLGPSSSFFPSASPSPSPGRGAAAPPDEAEDADAGVEPELGTANHYCAQHAKKAVVERVGVVRVRRVRRGGEGGEVEAEVKVRFEDWIPPALPLATQALLREYMVKPVSERDVEGYIYLHELVPSSAPSSSPVHSSSLSAQRAATTTTTLKLGRTLHPALRLSQWRSSCPSRVPIVRGIFPRAASPSPSDLPSSGGGGASAAPAHQAGVALRFAERGTRNHHRWERLCLIELAGRAEAFSLSSSASSSSSSTGGGASPAKAKGKGARKEKEEGHKVCADCGKRHVECFEVPSGAVSGQWGPTASLSAGAEQEAERWLAVEVVERWERWCRDVLG